MYTGTPWQDRVVKEAYRVSLRDGMGMWSASTGHGACPEARGWLDDWQTLRVGTSLPVFLRF